ncbi:unnamed protein product, partial [Musa acuminata var. zebrina]
VFVFLPFFLFLGLVGSRVHESTSGSPRIEVIGSSLGGLPPEDTKGSVALEIMRSYGLHAPSPGQHPYDLFHDGFGLTIDALEVGLRFPLNLVIEECLHYLPQGMPGGRESSQPERSS